MPKKNEMEIRFTSRSINEAFARTAVATFISQLDPTVEQISDVKMAVSEAVTNCIVHGYGENHKGTVLVKCAYEDKEVTIEVIDEGKGIPDVEQAMTTLYTTSPDEERAGLGFTVMESVMDHLEVYSKVNEGTTVKMTKSLR